MKLSGLINRLRREQASQNVVAPLSSSDAAPRSAVPVIQPHEEIHQSDLKRKRDPSEDDALSRKKAALLQALEQPPLPTPSPSTLAQQSGSLSPVVQRSTQEQVQAQRKTVNRGDFQVADPKLKLIATAREEYNGPNFIKGLRWSPDGLCLLSSGADNVLRLYETPPMSALPSSPAHIWRPVLSTKEAEDVYDYCWYPGMASSDPATCVFIATSRDHPIHMWDAYTGQRRATFIAYDQVEEVVPAFSLAFVDAGQHILAGFNKELCEFDVAQAGRPIRRVVTNYRRGGTIDRGLSLNGVISTIACHGSMVACGSFNSSIGLYDASSLAPTQLNARAHVGGLTYLKWSPEGTFLYSGARQDPEALCWDVRRFDQPLHRLRRTCRTNQRLFFDLDSSGKYFFTGSQDGEALVYDMANGAKLIQQTKLSLDSLNSVAVHPSLPLIATGSGQRRFLLPEVEGEEDPDTDYDLDQAVSLWESALLNPAA